MGLKNALALLAACALLAGCTVQGLSAQVPGCISASLAEKDEALGMSPAALLMLVLTAVLLLIAVLYMLSQVFNRREWEALAKVELTQTLIAASMIFITLWFSAFACSVAFELAGGDPFAVADSYLYDLIYREMVPSISMLWDIAWNADKMSSIMFGIVSCMYGVCFSPFSGYGMVSYAMNTFAGILAAPAASLMMQRIALSFIQQFAFAYLLPIGFILKIIPLTRDAGAYLIAIALGLYVVLPLTYVFNAVVMAEVAEDLVSVSDICAGEGGNALESTFSAGPLCGSVAVIGKILPQAVFLPAMNMVIVVSFTKTMAKIFARDYMLE